MLNSFRIEITLSEGRIAFITGIPDGCEVVIYDYDIKGAKQDDLVTDPFGVDCYKTIWGKPLEGLDKEARSEPECRLPAEAPTTGLNPAQFLYPEACPYCGSRDTGPSVDFNGYHYEPVVCQCCWRCWSNESRPTRSVGDSRLPDNKGD